MKVKYYKRDYEGTDYKAFYTDFWKIENDKVYWYDYHAVRSKKWLQVAATKQYMKETTEEISYNDFIIGLI